MTRPWCGNSHSKLSHLTHPDLLGDKPLSEPVLACCNLDPLETLFSGIWINIQQFIYKKMHLKMSSAKWWPVCSRERWINWELRYVYCSVVNISISGNIDSTEQHTTHTLINRFKLQTTFPKLNIMAQWKSGILPYVQSLVCVMAGCWTGNKPLPEPMMTKLIDAYFLYHT